MINYLLLDVANGPDSLELFGFLDQAYFPLPEAFSLLFDRIFRKNVFS
jgi:hypothetical protein